MTMSKVQQLERGLLIVETPVSVVLLMQNTWRQDDEK